jgi:hypothetical protein
MKKADLKAGDRFRLNNETFVFNYYRGTWVYGWTELNNQPGTREKSRTLQYKILKSNYTPMKSNGKMYTYCIKCE